MGNSKPDDSEALLQKSVDAARDSLKWMDDELGAARKTAADCTTASRKAIRERNISAALEQKQLAADLRVSNLTAELGQARIDLAELENDLARCRKAKQCQQDAAEFDKRIANFADKGDVAIKALAEWAKAMEPFKDLPDMLGTFLFFSNVAAESPATCAMQLVLLRQRRDAILAGGATLSRPAQPYIPPSSVPTTSVLSTRPIRWRDAAGDLHVEQKWREISLPVEVAARAVKLGAAVRPGHELWRQKG
jgi:hypothetical protein